MHPALSGNNSATDTLLFLPRKVPKAKRDPMLKHFTKLDGRLVKVARHITVLKHLDWPKVTQRKFLADFKRGKLRNPEVEHQAHSYREERLALTKIMKECDRSHPVGNFLYATAESYRAAARMVEAVGTASFTKHSRAIYGAPDEKIGWDELTHLEAADQLIDSTKEVIASYCVPADSYCLTPRYVAKRLRIALAPHFKHHPIKIVIDPNLASKACAGAKRIRVRSRTCFSEMDIAQLVNHEGFVHMLTMINGKEQTHLRSLGLAAPRTTKTQEGLATFAELLTGTIDLHRLLRLALRIRAVHMALDGADFVTVFKYFLEKGQSEEESFQSARRIFRGGDTAGRNVFTKDAVYLQGLILTHTFFRKAMQRNKFYLAQHLFSGRMTLGDAIALEPFFAYGYIRPPVYVPPWLINRECFAAHLCYYVFANRINLNEVRMKDFFDL